MKKKINPKIKKLKARKVNIGKKVKVKSLGHHIKYMALKVAVVVFAAVVLVGGYFTTFQSGITQEGVYFKVDNGATISSIASEMKKDGYINSVNLFKISVLMMGGKIQSGEYELKPGSSIWRIAKMMRSGDIASVDVLIQEGLTVKQVKKLLLDTPTLTGSVECDKTKPVLDSKKSGDENKPEEIKKQPLTDICNLKEGDLFPDTYRVARGTNRLDVLELARKKMESIRVGWENSHRSMPAPLKSWNEVITLASIVQKETPKDDEMPTVASVYLNRLRKKMKLQADPTVVYVVTHGLGDMQGRGLFSGHLKTKSPYNTYINYGLPPAPIANVGRSAIAAVLNPADTSYLFFVADGQGGHKFARSYQEHMKNQATWREIKKVLNQKNSEQK